MNFCCIAISSCHLNTVSQRQYSWTRSSSGADEEHSSLYSEAHSSSTQLVTDLLLSRGEKRALQLCIDLHGDVGTVLGAAAGLGHANGGLARHEALGGHTQVRVAGALHLLVQLGACRGNPTLPAVDDVSI